MNLDTNEVIRLRDGEEAPEGFVPIPEELQETANQELGDLESLVVTEGTPGGQKLIQWAKDMKRKRKSKKAMQKASRKRNRKKKR